MTDPNFYPMMASAALAGLAMLTVAGLAGWRGWLAFKSQELAALAHARSENFAGTVPQAGARIEIADLKERIRKLEAIAAGVEL